MDPTTGAPTTDNHLVLTAVALVAAGSALVGCFLPMLVFVDTSPPKVSMCNSSPSPDGRLVATVFVESGGGAAGYVNPNMTIHAAGTAFDPRERLLLDGGYLNLEARWLSNRLLEVSYSHVHQATERRASAMGVSIVYRQR